MSNSTQKKLFSHKLILNKYLFSLIGIDGFEDIRKNFSDPNLMGINSDGRSKLSVAFINKYENQLKIPKAHF